MAIVSGSRNVDLGPRAGRARQIDLAPQPFDDAFDHVHADAAARHACDLGRCREARQEQDLKEFVIGHGGVRRDQAAFNGAGRGCVRG